MAAAGQDTSEAASKIAEWNKRQDDFLEQTGFKRQQSREEIAGFTWKDQKAASKQAAESGGLDGYDNMTASPYDISQFERYQKVLGEHSPQTLEKFLDLKYNNPEKWDQLKYDYRTVNRYEVEGTASAEQILRLDEAAHQTKIHGFDYTKYSGDIRKDIKHLRTSGNAAVMEYDGNIYFAHSSVEGKSGEPRSDSYSGQYPLIGLSAHQRYETLNLGDGIPRTDDTEAKFFEHLATVLPKDSTATVTILSEKHMCESCQHVMEQFSEEFPGITVNVISGRRGYNDSAEGLKTWKYRKR